MLSKIKYSTYFDLLKVPYSFHVCQSTLKNNFRLLQTQYHPDKTINLDEPTQKWTQQVSIDINHGYKTLSNDIFRAEYICLLNNQAIDNSKIPLEKLTEIMDWNEIIESNDMFEIAKLKSELKIKYQLSINSLSLLFLQQKHDEFKQETLYLIFINNLLQKL
jgi:molecular chaperone HscB